VVGDSIECLFDGELTILGSRRGATCCTRRRPIRFTHAVSSASILE